MVRDDLQEIPDAALSEGFRFRPIHLDEGPLWTLIEREAEPYLEVSNRWFADNFLFNPSAVPHRCFFVVDANGVVAGTSSAWYNLSYQNKQWGQVHWVAIRPAYQRRGLARAALSETLRRLARWHHRALLFTQSKRVPAIRLYLEYGFEPVLETESNRTAWADYERRARELARS